MIRLVILFFVLIVDTVFIFINTFLLGLFFNRYGNFGKFQLMFWSKWIVKVAGLKFNVTGTENYDPNESYVVASNHRHLFDIPVLARATKLNLKFIAKKELFRIPVFGWILYLVGMVKVDRKNSTKALESLKKAQKIAEEHKISLTVFPEGTRSKKDGLLPFKKGAFMTSINTEIPLLPISVEGTDKILQGFKCKPRTINVHIHPPVDPKEYGVAKRNDFMKDVKKIIESKPHC